MNQNVQWKKKQLMKVPSRTTWWMVCKPCYEIYNGNLSSYKKEEPPRCFCVLVYWTPDCSSLSQVSWLSRYLVCRVFTWKCYPKVVCFSRTEYKSIFVHRACRSTRPIETLFFTNTYMLTENQNHTPLTSSMSNWRTLEDVSSLLNTLSLFFKSIHFHMDGRCLIYVLYPVRFTHQNGHCHIFSQKCNNNN